MALDKTGLSWAGGPLPRYLYLDFTGKTTATRITGRPAEHRRFKTKSTSVRWTLRDRSSGRWASDDTQSEPIRQNCPTMHSACNISLMCIHCWARDVGQGPPCPVSALCLKKGMAQLSKQPPKDAIVHSKGPREPFTECSLLLFWEVLSWDVRNHFLWCCSDLMTGAQHPAYLHFIFLRLSLQVIIKHCMSTDQREELIKGSLLM